MIFGFGNKKDKSDEPTQSQTIRGSVSGQIGQARGNLTQAQQATQSHSVQELSEVDVVELLEQMVALMRGSSLPENEKEKATSRLNAAKAEATEANPDKANIAKNLRRVVESAKSIKEVYEMLQPLLEQLVPWLGSDGNGLQ
ncbi:MAG: hypothetical protein SW833_19085 [Cyanobacteriota bacterium]|nr:hypothetical protein [Cyanobacteriota bacterium]